MIPCSTEFLNHPSRPKIRKKVFHKNSAKVLEWLEISERHATVEGRHIHLEALRLPFSADQIIEFGEHYKNTRKS